MTNLYRILAELEEQEIFLQKIKGYFDDLIYYRPMWYYNVKNFIKNIPLFTRLAWNWRNWDFYYSHILLESLLKEHARVFLKYGNHVNNEKSYRRAMTAAGMLRKAYDRDVDGAMKYLRKKNPYSVVKHVFNSKYNTNPDMYEKLYKIASDREVRLEKEVIQDAWAYIAKYSQTWWD